LSFRFAATVVVVVDDGAVVVDGATPAATEVAFGLGLGRAVVVVTCSGCARATATGAMSVAAVVDEAARLPLEPLQPAATSTPMTTTVAARARRAISSATNRTILGLGPWQSLHPIRRHD
jgi:hypothetical protein